MSRMIVASLLLAACTEPTEPEPIARTGGPTRYHVFKLDGLGGTTSGGNGISNLALISGTSTLADNTTTHATAWLLGFPIDLGTAGAPNSNSAVVWPVKNVRGLVSGITEVIGDDPLHEAWSCGAFVPRTPGHVCRGFVWEGGALRVLPTLGGPNGFATGTNNRRQTAGWAETAALDATCDQTTQFRNFRAVVWGPERDAIRELRPLGADPTSAATAINDRGQVAGISGACGTAVGSTSAAHAVLWEPDGSVVDLGGLGGAAWNTPMAINERGDVVGFANAAGTEPPTRFNYRPFGWTHAGGIRDLGTLDGDTRGQALGINERGQIVGFSRGTGFRGVIWQDGAVTDLNTLIASGSRDTITIAGDISDAGLITGTSVDAAGVSSAFLAVPTPH